VSKIECSGCGGQGHARCSRCLGEGTVDASTVDRCTSCGHELLAGKGQCIACSDASAAVTRVVRMEDVMRAAPATTAIECPRCGKAYKCEGCEVEEYTRGDDCDHDCEQCESAIIETEGNTDHLVGCSEGRDFRRDPCEQPAPIPSDALASGKSAGAATQKVCAAFSVVCNDLASFSKSDGSYDECLGTIARALGIEWDS
jgi:hypothetical protein